MFRFEMPRQPIITTIFDLAFCTLEFHTSVDFHVPVQFIFPGQNRVTKITLEVVVKLQLRHNQSLGQFGYDQNI